MGESPLVSVVVPCYNGERWIAEAIQSCLSQTYPQLEVIVVDDGSTDDSIAAIRHLGARIRLETGPNRGACHARNRGLALARGQFIQFLDADDYLLPEKLSRQVRFLVESGAEVVYGDWRHRYHWVDGSDSLGDVVVSGAREDLLEASLAGWWVAAHALLYRKEAVLKIGGWDERLPAAQDTDFLRRVALSGARIAYQPGCHAVYRRYGEVTLSTSSRRRWLDSHLLSLQKAETVLSREHRLTEKYRCALAQSYFHLARGYYDLDQRDYRRTMERVLSLCPNFSPSESRMYNCIQRLVGFEWAERLASCKRQRSRNLRAQAPEG